MDIDAGTAFPAHSHMYEQTVNIIFGEFNFMIDDENKLMLLGDAAVIVQNITHSGYAKTDGRLIDVLFPIGDDYVERDSK